MATKVTFNTEIFADQVSVGSQLDHGRQPGPWRGHGGRAGGATGAGGESCRISPVSSRVYYSMPFAWWSGR